MMKLRMMALFLVLVGAAVARGDAQSAAYDGPVVFPPPVNASYPVVIVVHDAKHGSIYKVFGPFKTRREVKYWLVNNEQFWFCDNVAHAPCGATYTVEHLYKPNLAELVD